MNTEEPYLKLTLNELGKEPLIKECRWVGSSRRKDPDLSDVRNGKLRRRALCILFLLAKYRAYISATHAPADPSDAVILFQPKCNRNTWVASLAVAYVKQDLAGWIRQKFGYASDGEVFLSGGVGGMYVIGGMEKPHVKFYPQRFPLSRLRIWRLVRAGISQELNGIDLLECAFQLESGHWKNEVIKLEHGDIYDAKIGKLKRDGIAETHSAPPPLSERAAMVREFLHNLAENGLSGRLLFPPPHWHGDSLRSFCNTPRFVDQLTWEKQQRPGTARIPHETEFSDEDTTPSYLPSHFVTLTDLLGDGRCPPKHRRTIIRGYPGEGKTIALWMHIAAKCTALIARLDSGDLDVDDPQFTVPLVVALGGGRPPGADLITWAIESVIAISCRYWEERKVTALRGWLRHRVKTDAYNLSLDALDEITSLDSSNPNDWLREQIRHISQSIHILLTTRPGTADTLLELGTGQSSQQFKIYRMINYNQEQICSYIKSYFGEDSARAELLLRVLQMSPGPKQLARLPLLLAILCYANEHNEPTEPLPSTRTAMLGIAFWHLLERGNKRRAEKCEAYGTGTDSGATGDSSNNFKEALMRSIAFKFWKDGPIPIPESELHDCVRVFLDQFKRVKTLEYSQLCLPARSTAPNLLINELCGDGILVKMIVAGRTHFRILLRSFHEYLLAGYFASEPEKRREKRILDFISWRQWQDESWIYVWPLAVGQSAAIARQVLSTFNVPNYYLSRNDEKTARFLGMIIAEGSASQLGGWTATLMQLLRMHGGTRSSIAFAILEIGGEVVEEELLEYALGGRIGYWGRYQCLDSEYKLLCAVVGNKTVARLIPMLKDQFNQARRSRACSALWNFCGSEGRCAIMEYFYSITNKASFDDSNTDFAFDIIDRIYASIEYGWLIKILQDKSRCPAIRSRAIEAYGYNTIFPPSDSLIWGILEERLRDVLEDPGVRQECACAFGRFGKDDSHCCILRDCLFDARNDLEGRVRTSCAQGLASTRGNENENRAALIRRLMDSAEDPFGVVRSACVDSLKRLGDANSRAAISMRLGDTNHDPTGCIRFSCASALGTIGGPEHRAVLVDRLYNSDGVDQRDCAVDSLEATNDVECHSILVARLADPTGDWDARIRVRCAKALAKIDEPKYKAVIHDAFLDDAGDPTGDLRYSCAQILGKTAHEQLRPSFISRLLYAVSSALDVGADCIDALASLGDIESRNALIEGLRKHRDSNVRRRCALGLESIGDSESRAALIDALRAPLERDNDESKWQCAEILGRLGTKECISALVATFDSLEVDFRNWELSRSCAVALAKIGGDVCRDSLIIHLRRPGPDENGIVREFCIGGLVQLGMMGDEVSYLALVERLFDPTDDLDGWVRGVCAFWLYRFKCMPVRAALIKRLIDGSDDRFGFIRRNCAWSLGRIGDDTCRSALISHLHEGDLDENGAIRSACAQALGLVGDEVSVGALIKRLLSDEDDGNGWVRFACVKVLSELSKPQALQAIKKCFAMSQLPDCVRQACHEALLISKSGTTSFDYFTNGFWPSLLPPKI